MCRLFVHAGRDICGTGSFFMSCRLQGKENMKIDYYAYHSGMNGWNAGLKMLLAVGTLCLTIALDKPAVSLFVLLTMSLLTLIDVYKRQSKVRKAASSGMCSCFSRRALTTPRASILFSQMMALGGTGSERR